MIEAPPPPVSAPESKGERVDPARAAALVEELRQKKRGKTNMPLNILMFIGVLLAFIAFTRWYNQGKPKEATMFGGGGPASGGPSMEGPPAAAGPNVSGTVKIAPDVAPVANGTLFVMVRLAGTPDRGPPLAVSKMDAPIFPVKFEVGARDIMLKGMPFTGPFDIYARLDRDGDPMTRDPEDVVLAAPIPGVMPGQSIEMTLARKVKDAPAAPAAPEQPAAPASAPAAAAPAAAPAATGEPIAGEVSVAENIVAGAPANGTVFVIVRMAGTPDRGPPLAVKKIDQPVLPVRFEIGPGDIMLQGMPWIGPFDVYVRLDADGNAMTRAPGDLELSAPVAAKPGEKALKLVLDKRR